MEHVDNVRNAIQSGHQSLYDYIGMLQDCFQPKIGRKVRMFGLRPEKQYSYKKKKERVYSLLKIVYFKIGELA